MRIVWTNPRPYLLCSLVLTVSRGKREMSTAMPAMPPDTREVRKLGSLILSLATRDKQDGVCQYLKCR